MAQKNPNDNYEYLLHAVIIHHGDSKKGHYYPILRPYIEENDRFFPENCWMKFDDECILPLTEKQMFQHAYGNNKFVYFNSPFVVALQDAPRSDFGVCAYILCYVRKDKHQSIFLCKPPVNIGTKSDPSNMSNKKNASSNSNNESEKVTESLSSSNEGNSDFSSEWDHVSPSQSPIPTLNDDTAISKLLPQKPNLSNFQTPTSKTRYVRINIYIENK